MTRLVRIAVLWVCAWLVALAQTANPIPALRTAAFARDLAKAESVLAEYRSTKPATPQLLEAVSWAGRAAAFAKDWDKAERYAREAYDGSVGLLTSRPLDADRSLPIALGAAIEVLGLAQDARGDRGGAVTFLRAELARHKGTSIETRIQKNILVLSAEGKPAPAIEAPQWIGGKPKSLAEMKGQVVLAFFWAHWCGDCKRQLPVLERLVTEYGSRGLTVIGPTQLYGYIARGESAAPEKEMEYLRGEYQQRYPIPAWMRVPVSSKNFLNFGVSTTPTLMLVDREGIVRMYHPGNLTYEELAAKIEPLLKPRT